MCFVEMFFCQQDSFAKEVGLDLRKGVRGVDGMRTFDSCIDETLF